MKFICNSCGREFDENTQSYTHTAENGTEYTVCEECENDGIEVVETTTYCVCSTCGFICEKGVFDGVCEFCGANDSFAEMELTQAEEHDFDANSLQVYEEKFGKDFADKISEWKNSEAKKKVDASHKRDMRIDTIFVLGIILAYFMGDYAIRNFFADKLKFVALMVPTILALIISPIFKKCDKKRVRKLPLWLILAAMAVFLDIYWLILFYVK